MMKKHESIVTKRIVAGLMMGLMLGSAGYVPAAEAGQVIIVVTQDDYDTVKDVNGNVQATELTDNTITIGVDGGTAPAISGNVIGAYTESMAGVEHNKVFVKSGTMNYVLGGGSFNYATGNSVTISGGEIYSFVYGGWSRDGAATNNTVTISVGTINDSIYGGYSVNGAAEGNIVTITSGTLTDKVYGGWSRNGDTTGNSVIINDGTINNSVSGGYSEDGVADDNTVAISGGMLTNKVYGGWSKSGTVTGNTITINSGKLSDKVYGGYSEDSAVTGNTVMISAGEINSWVYGGYSDRDKTVTGNKVMISGGEINGWASGGFSGAGLATGNTVDISGGEIKIDVNGGYSAAGAAENNTATIRGGKVNNVYGGHSYMSDVMHNSVIISAGTIAGNVYGGLSDGAASVSGNNINISGQPSFGANTVLYGGISGSGGNISGNTLNLNSKGLTVANVKNFDVYNFYLPDTVQAGDVLLTATGGSTNEQTDLTGSSVNVGIAGSAPALQSGDNVTLLHNANGILADDTTVYGKITQGVSLEYDFTTVLENGDSLVTTITRTGISDDTKSLVETQAAAVGFINSGADLLVGSGITSMSEVTSAEDSTIFGAMSGGSMRYDTGSHADVKGYNFALGMGKAVVNNTGKLTFGPFVEYGYGDYTSYLDNGVRGDGKTKYYGVGVLARQDNNSGVYYEGSLRYGRMDADYASNDLGTAGVHSSYDSSSAYYGAHLGIGKVTELNESTKADVYAKLLYTHQNGDSVTLQGEGNGEVYDFDAVDSTRARVGARVSKAYSERGTGYVGLAYEYEFDGEARATVKGFSTPSPSIQGSSGLLELGYILQPKGVNDPTINIGLQGWGGKKQGVTGNVNFVWKF